MGVFVLTKQELCCSLVAVSTAALGDEQCMPGAGSQEVHRGVLGTERVEQLGVSHALESVRPAVVSPTARVGTLLFVSPQTLVHSSCHRPR